METAPSPSTLPQFEKARTLLQRAQETSRGVLDSVGRNELSATTASDIMRAARQGMGALLAWHRVYDEDASYLELLRRAENLAAPVATPARILAPVAAAAGKDALDAVDLELVRSAAFTLRNLVNAVAAHLPVSIDDRRGSAPPPAHKPPTATVSRP
jgi:hypothetical protein